MGKKVEQCHINVCVSHLRQNKLLRGPAMPKMVVVIETLTDLYGFSCPETLPKAERLKVCAEYLVKKKLVNPKGKSAKAMSLPWIANPSAVIAKLPDKPAVTVKTVKRLSEKQKKAKRPDDFTLKLRGEKTKEQLFAEWVQTDAFLRSYEWNQLRYKVLLVYGRVCLCCGSTRDIQVDHIRPRNRYPELALDFDNAQPMCSSCNMGKGNWDQTDWRPK